MSMRRSMMTAAGGGAFGSEVSLLLHCDGVDEGTTFTDSSSFAHTVTVTGTANTETSNKKFGTASLEFGATNGLLTIPNDESFRFGTGDWSIDFQMYWSSTGGTYVIFSKGATSDLYQPYFIFSDFRLILDGVQIIAKQSIGITTDSWNHVEVSKTNNFLYVFTEGVLKISQGDFNAYNGGTLPLAIGRDQGSTFSIGHFLDEIRIQKGTFGHTANFTPPSAPYAP